MRVAGTHARYARPTIADVAHRVPKRAPHARPRPPRRISPTCAKQHPLNPWTHPPECLAHGVPVIRIGQPDAGAPPSRPRYRNRHTALSSRPADGNTVAILENFFFFGTDTSIHTEH